ncbi:hypothetical protein [Streptomyces sp. NPDC049813]|uniref:hypothetical protein n=1 Tax=Streptomyces sp. NPDC049813 TaxID=3365597 RepID=UPI003796361E
MADPDNVARLIATGSAVAAAANATLTYANFRRKRPTVHVTHAAFRLKSREAAADGSAGQAVPTFSARLTTRSEVDVKIGSVVVLFYDYKWVLIKTRHGQVRKKELRYLGTYPLRTEGAEQITMEAFGRRTPQWVLPPRPDDSEGVHPARARLRLELSNGQTVSSRWINVPHPVFPTCRCPRCATPWTQLTFDDAAG